MKYIYLLLLTVFGFLVASSLCAQNYNTVDEETGNWHILSSWEGAIAGSSNGSTTSLSENNMNVNIRGKITLDENLSISGNGAALRINENDTLVVIGDLSVTGQGKLNIETGGVLVITGDLDIGGNTDINNNAVVLVLGNFSQGGSSTVNDNGGATGGFYVFGTSQIKSDNLTTKSESEAQENIADLYNEYVTPQPIDLLSFSSTPLAQSVVLRWTTAMEENFDFFTVERAGADLHFEAIGTQAGNGFSTSPLDYQFEDHHPLPGVNYYRLKATDLDGSSEYHKAISAWFKGGAASQVYPNPVINRQFTLAGSVTQLQVMNLMGHVVVRQPISESRQTVDLPQHMQAGTYIALVTYTDGTQEKHSLIVY